MGNLKEEINKSEDYKNIKFQFIKLQKENKKHKFLIYVRDDQNIMKPSIAHSVDNKEEIENLKMEPGQHSYIYTYPPSSPLDIKNLENWFKDVVITKKAEESFKSQEAPFYRKYSKKLVASNF